MPADQLEIVARGDRIEFNVKVVPGASRKKIAGPWGTALKIAVCAPPEAGQANAAVTALLAALLGVKKTQVTIVRGHTHPLKRIAVTGVTIPDARALLTP